ncbi:MAG: exonuclease domain-containing protein [Myxococcota bacterium]
MDYFCVDVESSGPTPGLHNLLSIGLVHVRRTDGAYRAFDDLYVELRPVFPEFDEAAMRVNKLDVTRLKSEGLSPERAVTKMVDWIEDQRTTRNQRPVFVAHNAPFDWMYFTYYCGHAKTDNPFGYSALDTKALAMGKLQIPWSETTLKNICRLMPEVEPMDPTKLHHAVEDARYTARIFSGLMAR